MRFRPGHQHRPLLLNVAGKFAGRAGMYLQKTFTYFNAAFPPQAKC
jgi:hypothetical protein